MSVVLIILCTILGATLGVAFITGLNFIVGNNDKSTKARRRQRSDKGIRRGPNIRSAKIWPALD